MACSAGPNVVKDDLILNTDPINLEKNLTTNTSTNFLQNGSFSGGTGVTYESGSNPTNTIVELENPGDSQYVVRQNGNNTEYHMNIDGGAQGTLSASTQYVMSGWYAKSSDYNGGDTMFHARAFSSGGSHNFTSNGIGTLLYSKVVGGLTWQFRYRTITTPSDYNGDFDWYMGYGTNNTAGYRYYTGLKVEEGSFPSALDLSRNGNDAKVKGATFYSDGYFTFDGVNDGMKIPRTHLYQTGNQISVEAWINADDISDQDHQAFFTIGGVTATQRDRMFQMRVSEHGGTDGHITALYRNSANNAWQILRTSNPVIVNNTWYHVVSTYTYGTGSSWKIYINGVEQSVTFSSGNGNADPIQPADPSIYIGLGEDGRPAFNTGSGEEWLGKIGKVGLYHKTLTAAEVKQNFNALRGRFGI